MPDLILAGGGLANGLLAYRLRMLRPEVSLLMLEKAGQLGGAHTWSFHATDLTPAQNAWIAPFVVHDWPCYDVAFPKLTRRVGLAYRSITAARFRDLIAATLGGDARIGVEVTEVRPDRVRLASGEEIAAGAVIDGRGFRPGGGLVHRFQLFLGREVRLAAPHGLTVPVIMDATVEQEGGYRFLYLLPFAPDVLLIEDTRYADSPHLDLATLRDRIAAYAASRGWRIVEVLREETGVLPVTLSGDMAAYWAGFPPDQPLSGLRAGLYHPTTGYSLPEAVRLADRIAAAPDLSAAALRALIHREAEAAWRRHRFFRLLNRMLFLAGPARERYVVMRRFYRMPEPLIARFYAGALSSLDKLRLLAGRPPVPVLGALRALRAGRP